MPEICLTYVCIMLGYYINFSKLCYAIITNFKLSVVFATGPSMEGYGLFPNTFNEKLMMLMQLPYRLYLRSWEKNEVMEKYTLPVNISDKK